MKLFRNPESIHPPLAAYSHQVELDSSERILILSGQVGMTKDGSIPEDPIDQLKEALANIEINLKAANMGKSNLIKLTFYIVGEMDPQDRKEAMAGFFGEFRPCMTLLFVPSLAGPDIKVEIEAMASCESI